MVEDWLALMRNMNGGYIWTGRLLVINHEVTTGALTLREDSTIGRIDGSLCVISRSKQSGIFQLEASASSSRLPIYIMSAIRSR